MSARLRNLLTAVVAATCVARASAVPIVQDGDVVAIIGDSITEGRTYSVLMEAYLLMCQPANVRAMQFGWGGEDVGGLNHRLPDFAALKPTVVTLCYGMNDGRYVPVTDKIRGDYQKGLLRAVQMLQQGGAKVVVGSPGAVDPAAFRRDSVSAADYNKNLSALKDEAAAVAKLTGSAFADVHTPMVASMKPAKAKYGDGYSIAGGDGFHPKFAGGLVMAYAFLKGMGFDGNVGTLYVDLANHTAKAYGGHAFDKADGDAFTFTSTVYPFCFGDDNDDHDTAVAARHAVPFDAELNRFTLTAVGPAKRYRVTWGTRSIEFTADRLKSGINLTAEFEETPFDRPFLAAMNKVQDKQVHEVLLLKQLLHDAITAAPLMPDNRGAVTEIGHAVAAGQAKLSADIARSIRPVRHTITFQALD